MTIRRTRTGRLARCVTPATPQLPPHQPPLADASPRPGRRWRFAAGTLAVGLALSAALAGCGGGSSNDNASTAGQADAPGFNEQQPGGGDTGTQDRAATQAGAGTNKQAPPASPGQAPQDPLVAATRSIIYTGTITVRVTNVDKAASDVLALVNGTDGFVGADERRNNDGGRSEAKIILRVPASRFTSTLDAIKKLGTEESRQVSTQDVTEQLVDLEARVANQKASVERVRALLARAQTIGEIVQLEAELSRREAELNSLTGRKNKLDDLTALSTVTVQLLGPDAKLDETRDEDDTGFVAGLERGWKAFLESLEILLTVLGALLPWAIGLGVPVYLVVLLLRRLPRRRGEAAVATAPAYAYTGGMRPVGTPAPAPQQPAPTPVSAPPAAAADQAAPDREAADPAQAEPDGDRPESTPPPR